MAVDRRFRANGADQRGEPDPWRPERELPFRAVDDPGQLRILLGKLGKRLWLHAAEVVEARAVAVRVPPSGVGLRELPPRLLWWGGVWGSGGGQQAELCRNQDI